MRRESRCLMYLLRPRGRHTKGDLVVESFLNYGPRSLPGFVKREDESSRKNRRKVRLATLDKARLRCGGISATAIIPAGTQCEPAGLKGEALRNYSGEYSIERKVF
jgi:hypothetical protein